jgi:hypothetical protein
MTINQKYYLRRIQTSVLGQYLNEVFRSRQRGETILYDVLECGHIQPVVKDIYGETNAYRRRCRKCPKQQPPQALN